MTGMVVSSVMQASKGLVVQEASIEGTAQTNSMPTLWFKWATAVTIGVVLLCIRMFVKRGRLGRNKDAVPAMTAMQIEARRKSAWERKQAQLDELAVAAVAAKQERIRMEEEARVAVSVVKEAKEKALICSRAADEARMRRRRAGDQVRILANDENRQMFEERRREAEERTTEETLASIKVEQAVSRLKDLRNWLSENEKRTAE